MPMSKYNKHFGSKPGAAEKAKAAMRTQYGSKKGEQVFYATMNKKKSSLQDHIAEMKRSGKLKRTKRS